MKPFFITFAFLALWIWNDSSALAVPAPIGPTVSNLRPRYDVDGKIVDAHDGCLQWFNGKYYLYGTRYGNTDGFGTTNRYVCYSSNDLFSWKNEGELIQPPYLIGVYYRPYVIHNAATGKYVLWYNWYDTSWTGYIGVATSDHPQGPFTIQNPKVQLAQANPGDLNLMVDTDGTAYIIYTSIANNHSISIERLANDYLSSTQESSGFLDSGSEAPVLFHRQGVYYAVFGAAINFSPTGSDAKVFTASHPLGPYTPRGNINLNSSGRLIVAAQQTYVAQLPSPAGTAYIWMADCWESRPDGIKGHDFQHWSRSLQFQRNGTIDPLVWDFNIGDKNFHYPANPIVIYQARYGDLSSTVPGRVIDVSNTIRRLVAEGETRLHVALLSEIEGDPAPDLEKTLEVRYFRLGGQETTRSATDSQIIEL